MAQTKDIAYNFGQFGSMITSAGNAAIKPPTGKVFVAVTMILSTKFDAHGGLVAVQDSTNGLEYVSTEDGSGVAQTSHDASAGSETALTGSEGLVVGAWNFPQGMTIYGRWSEIDVDTGRVIAYIGE